MRPVIPSNSRFRRLNRRQRKKLRVGEFQELIFEISATFKTALDSAAWDLFIDEFCERVASHGLGLCGFGGWLPLTETDGCIQKRGRGSPTVQQRQDLIAWLLKRPEIKDASHGPWVDAWYDGKPIESESVIVLTRRESIRLLEVLENPPERNEKFLQAQARHQKLFSESEAEFVRRGKAAIQRTIANGDGIPAEVVIAKLEAKVEAARLRQAASLFASRVLKEHSPVSLARALPSHGLAKGAMGVVVHVYEEGRAYEVEFFEASGKSIGVQTVEATNLRPAYEPDV